MAVVRVGSIGRKEASGEKQKGEEQEELGQQVVGGSGAEGRRASEVKLWTEEFWLQEGESGLAGVSW